MKRILLIISVLLAFSFTSDAQVKIATRSFRLADFSARTTKVVLTGESVIDAMLKSEISRRWRVSPYEFCSPDEFEKGRTQKGFYYLAILREFKGKDNIPGLSYLTVIKGGPAKTSNPDEKGFEVASIPYCGGKAGLGRETEYLPAFIDIIQNYLLSAMSSEKTAYAGLSGMISRGNGKVSRHIFIAESDLAPGTDASGSQNIEITSDETVSDILAAGSAGAVVSYVVVPPDPQTGDICYTMLVTADTHELYLFRKHRISPSSGPGFRSSDLKPVL